MRKVFHLALIAAATLSLAACQKEIESPVATTKGNEIQLNFSSVKPNLIDIKTKTAWTGETITWSKNDAIRVAYTVNGIWQAGEAAASSNVKAKLYASDQLNADAEVATFAVSANFKDTQNAGLTDPEYKFFAIYPSGLVSGTDFTNPPHVPFSISSEQTPKANSFDGALDVMYATSNDYDGIPSDRNVDLYWHRIVSHADIAMRNLQVEAGETLESITVTAQTGADLVGSHTLNITDGTVALASGATAGNSVTVKADNLTLSDGAVEFWFTSLPFTATELNFTVKTSKYTYVRTFEGINLNFLGNARNTLSVNMKKAQKFQDYTESFSNGQGEFIIVENVEGVWRSGSYNDDKYMQASAYINKTNNESEAWLISPSLSILSNSSKLSFNHLVTTFFGNVTNEATVRIREHGGEWETEALPITYPTIETGNYSEFEETTVDLGKYAGKVVEIGFKYISSTEHAGTWRVKDFKVTNAEVKYYPSFEFTSATTKEVSFTASTVEFTYSAAHLTSNPTVAIKAGSDDIIDGTPTIADGKITVNVKANNDEVAKTATLVVTCEGVDNIPELVINQAKKENLVETEATIDFSKQGYSNEQQVSSLTQDPFTVTFTNGGTNTAYYNTGSAVRVYNGGTMTVSSEYTITKIEIAGNAQKGATLSADGLSGTTWTGSSNSVTISVGTAGHYRFQTLTITYLAPASEVPTTPSITLSNLPTENISAEGDVVTINYQIENPVSGVSVSAAPASGVTWVYDFDYSVAGEITFAVDPKTTTGTRTTTITVSYTGAESKTFEITQDGVQQQPGDPVTIPVSVAAYASSNSWSNQSQYLTINLDANVTATAGPSNASNTGKYYSTDNSWRFYANEDATLTIDAGSKTIESVTLTYTVKDSGTISKSGTNVTSGTAVSVNASSVQFAIGQSTGSKGKIFITAISVTYK